ncbi:integumentary mucin C.1-like [Homalodisca vitripennis]|uniref:integumentary mucin C.1-like n=1 Tax=Homalodisca vitripennis TaxID=197043 RepID=UPI001EEC6148|nr:integumentary mucin C.1-like [Homalodisca vitripennis]
MWAVSLLFVAASTAVCAAPGPQTAAPATPNKSAFVPAFDEIVVESSLTVRGRSGPTSPTQRQGRTRLLVVPTPGTPLNSTSLSSNTTDPTTTTTTTTVSTTTSSTTTSTTEKS